MTGGGVVKVAMRAGVIEIARWVDGGYYWFDGGD